MCEEAWEIWHEMRKGLPEEGEHFEVWACGCFHYAGPACPTPLLTVERGRRLRYRPSFVLELENAA